MRSLQDFASTDSQPLFPEATTLPDFFHNNLVDPARVVKAFHNDPQANIRIFYYQYLKLCFELDDADYEGYIGKIQTIINNEGFKFIFYEDDDPALFSDMQFKSLIMQFFGVLGDGNIALDDAINRYPIMDTVFIYFFRAILILTGKTESLDSYIERDQLLQYLCSYFGVQISLHDRCIKFVETDIFAYEEDPKDVYMAFMDYERLQNMQNASQSYSGQVQPEQNQTQAYQNEQTYQHEQQGSHMFNQHLQDHHSIPINLEKHAKIQTSPSTSEQNIYPAPNPPPININSIKLQNNYQIPSHSLPYDPLSNNSSRRGNTEVNQSYISTDFVDYTHPNHTLSSLLPANGLKQSDTLDFPRTTNFENIIKNQTPNRVEEPKQNATPNKPSGFKPEPQKAYSYADSLSYSAQTNTNTYGYGSLQDKNYSNPTSGTTSYAASKSNLHSQVQPISKKIQETKYTTPNQWEPTKDPGFALKYPSNQYSSTNPPFQPQTQAYQPQIQLYKPSAELYKPPSPIESYKPPTATEPYKPDQYKPSSYKPYTANDFNYSETKKTNSNDVKPQSAQPAYPSSYQNQYNPVPVAKPASGKNPFGLNVSLEFTNSFTMKIMNEPFRSNVATIRNRARNFRNSLAGFIK